MTVRRFGSNAEADRADREYWLSLTEAERVLEAWRLSEEQWRLQGEWMDEPGLSRSVARVHRR
jgi:hypothetical protein